MALAPSSTSSTSAGAPDLGAPGGWAQAILANLGAPYDLSTDDGARNVAFLEAWKKAEGTSAKYNPLATTLTLPGSSDFNSIGVQSYASPTDGVTATTKTLLAGYPHVVSALRAGDPAGIVQSAGGLSDLNRWVSGKSSPNPSSYTSTISSLFFSLLGQGATAYSGFGVGNFPVGHTTPAQAAGDAARAAANATGVTALASIASSVGAGVGALLNANTWRRIGLALAGIVLMVIGANILARGAGAAAGISPATVMAAMA